MATRKVVVDPSLAVNVNFGTPRGPEKYPTCRGSNFDPHINMDSLFTQGLSVLNVGSAGSLEVIPETTNLRHRILVLLAKTQDS